MGKTYAEDFYYDETSPTFLRHKVDKYTSNGYRLTAIKDSPAGWIDVSTNYNMVSFNGKNTKGHYVVLDLFGIEIPEGHVVDHLDRVRQNNHISNLRVVTKEHNSRNRTKVKSNSSGITGVGWCVDRVKGFEYTSAYCQWCDLEGNQHKKRFSVLMYGLLPAFQKAAVYRQKMIERLNEQGAGYSDLHGKEIRSNYEFY